MVIDVHIIHYREVIDTTINTTKDPFNTTENDAEMDKNYSPALPQIIIETGSYLPIPPTKSVKENKEIRTRLFSNLLIHLVIGQKKNVKHFWKVLKTVDQRGRKLRCEYPHIHYHRSVFIHRRTFQSYNLIVVPPF